MAISVIVSSDFTDITGEFSGVQQVIDAASDKEDSAYLHTAVVDAFS
ncbi:hypothetical protein OH492_10640 [Vibrio chagasii]|nr:hypothetical protein [Vibrio chagasii]